MLEVFQNKCLRRILHTFWPNKITNAEFHERTGMLPISIEVKKRRFDCSVNEELFLTNEMFLFPVLHVETVNSFT